MLFFANIEKTFATLVLSAEAPRNKQYTIQYTFIIYCTVTGHVPSTIERITYQGIYTFEARQH